MAITLNSVKCPECGATLPIEEGRTQVFCSYCGAKVIVTNENEYIYRHIDEAGIKQVLTIIWMALSLIVLVICIVKIAVQDDFTTGFLMLFYIGGPVIGGGAYLIFKVIPEKETDKVLMSSGGIRLPKDIFPYSDKNYEAVNASLRNAGFNNVTCINMHDLTLGLLQKPGTVESISVNGEKLVNWGRVYMPSVPITITYHGK